MLKNILSVLPKGTPRNPVIYYRLLDTLSARMVVVRNKFNMANLIRTSGSDLLRWMLLSFDLTQAKSYRDDIDLYTSYASDFTDTYRSAFDPVWSKSLSLNGFTTTKTGSSPAEIFINCTVSNPSVYYPFGSGWDKWRDLRALHIVYHNSTELPIDLYTGKVVFSQKFPTFVVIAINVPTLLMKWFKYNENCAMSKENPDPIKFLKETEYNKLFDDLVDIWTVNLIEKVVTHPEATANKIVSDVAIPTFITTPGIVENGVTGLQDLMRLLDNRNVKLQDIMETRLFTAGRTLKSYIQNLDSIISVPDLRQYQWINISKTLPYLKLISAIIGRDRENPVYKQLAMKAYWSYVRYIRTANLPSLQYMNALKTYIGVVSKEFEALFDESIKNPGEDLP